MTPGAGPGVVRSRPAGGLRGRLATAASILGFAVAVVGLHLLGRGELCAPPVGSLDALQAWARDRTPVGAALALVRLGALGAAYHLLVVTLVAALARLSGRAVLADLVGRATIPAWRGLVGAVAGFGLGATSAATAGVVVATPGTAAADPTPATASTASLVHLSAGAVTLEHLGGPQEASITGTATLFRLDPAAPEPAPVEHRAPADDAPARDPGAREHAGPDGRTHVVVPGDHLWALAEGELATGATSAPSMAEVDGYWLRVVRANPQLGDPDLLFPGDVIVLPPVPGR